MTSIFTNTTSTPEMVLNNTTMLKTGQEESRSDFVLTHDMYQQLMQRIAFLEAQMENKGVVKASVTKKPTKQFVCKKVKKKPSNMILPFHYNETGCQGLLRCHGLFVQCSGDVTDGQYCAKHNKEILSSSNNKPKYGTAIERKSSEYKFGNIKPKHYMTIVNEKGIKIEEAKKAYKDMYGIDMPAEHLVESKKLSASKKKKSKKIKSTVVSEEFDGTPTIMTTPITTKENNNTVPKKKKAKSSSSTKLKGKPKRFVPKGVEKYSEGMRNKDGGVYLRYIVCPDNTYQLQKPDTWSDEAKELIIKQYGPIGSKLPEKKKRAVSKKKKKKQTQSSVFQEIQVAAVTEETINNVLSTVVEQVDEETKVSATPIVEQVDEETKVSATPIVEQVDEETKVNTITQNVESVDEEMVNIDFITIDLDSMSIESDDDDGEEIEEEEIIVDEEEHEIEEEDSDDEEEISEIDDDLDELEEEMIQPYNCVPFTHDALNSEEGYSIDPNTLNIWNSEGQLYGTYEQDTDEIIVV